MDNSDKEEALADLIGEINAAAEFTLGPEYNLRDVAGRNVGYHGAIQQGNLPEYLKYPGEKGGKRKMRGGANCENTFAIRLAVDSAIILAGAASLVGVGYGGYQTLLIFMTTYGLKETTIAIITSLYDTLASAGTGLWDIGASVVSTANTTIRSGLSISGSILTALNNAIGPTTITLIKLAPGVAIGRYMGTDKSAQADAIDAIAGLRGQYQILSDYTGAVTRSISAKKDALQVKIAAASNAASTAAANISASASAATNQTTGAYAAIKGKICGLINDFDTMPGPINDLMARLNDSLSTMDISGGKRRMKSRRMKSRKIKSRKNKSRKNHKSRKHYRK